MTKGMQIKAGLLLAGLCFCVANCSAVNPASVILVDAAVNKQTVHLTLDTGTDGIYLFHSAALRLSLSLTPVPTHLRATNSAGKFLAQTEKCAVSYLGTSKKMQLGVMDKPISWDRNTDGILGWPALRGLIFELELAGTNTALHLLKSPPKDIKGWVRVPLDRSASQLLLQLPDVRHATAPVMFDTGNQTGICLSPKRWRELKKTNPDMPLTLTICNSFYTTVPTAVEESFARNLSIGTLSLTNAPLLEGLAPMFDGSCEVMLGLETLACMDVIIDGKHSCAYLRPKKPLTAPYRHNRAGVVFLLHDLENFDAVARVIPGSPAAEAGVRDGDIIMKCDGKWRTNWDESPNELFCNRPASTKVDLVLKRGEELVKATVTLHDILPLNEAAPASK